MFGRDTKSKLYCILPEPVDDTANETTKSNYGPDLTVNRSQVISITQKQEKPFEKLQIYVPNSIFLASHQSVGERRTDFETNHKFQSPSLHLFQKCFHHLRE